MPRSRPKRAASSATAYKRADPRVPLIRQLLDQLSAKARADTDPLLAVALEIDRVASSDPYFIERGLTANSDLYGCFVYSAL